MSIEKFLSNVVVDGTISKVGGTSTQFLKADGSSDISVYALDSNVVHKTGNETVAGVKTFSSSPIVPTAVNANEAVNKGQLDALISQTVTNGVTTSSPSQDAVYDFVTANAGTSGTSGTYTPTVTNGLNVISTIFVPSIYTKIGNIVTVTVTIEAAVIAANSPASVTISLPFNRSTSGNDFVCGSGSAIEYSSNTYGSAVFKLKNNTTEVTIHFYPATPGGNTLTGTFSYPVN